MGSEADWRARRSRRHRPYPRASRAETATLIIRRSVETVATSHADDAAYLALEDVARVTEQLDDVRVVGGYMASLLLTAFAVRGAVIRRTADADAAIPATIAASGQIQHRTDGCRLHRQQSQPLHEGPLEVDLLVPSGTAQFLRAEHGATGSTRHPG